jgi:hypothetical protein
MQANPEKFQAIAVGKKSFDKSPIFQIGTANISCDEVIKLLGVDIDLIKMKPLYEYITFLLQNIYYLVKRRMRRKGVVVCIVV